MFVPSPFHPMLATSAPESRAVTLTVRFAADQRTRAVGLSSLRAFRDRVESARPDHSREAITRTALQSWFPWDSAAAARGTVSDRYEMLPAAERIKITDCLLDIANAALRQRRS